MPQTSKPGGIKATPCSLLCNPVLHLNVAALLIGLYICTSKKNVTKELALPINVRWAKWGLDSVRAQVPRASVTFSISTDIRLASDAPFD